MAIKQTLFFQMARRPLFAGLGVTLGLVAFALFMVVLQIGGDVGGPSPCVQSSPPAAELSAFVAMGPFFCGAVYFFVEQLRVSPGHGLVLLGPLMGLGFALAFYSFTESARLHGHRRRLWPLAWCAVYLIAGQVMGLGAAFPLLFIPFLAWADPDAVSGGEHNATADRYLSWVSRFAFWSLTCWFAWLTALMVSSVGPDPPIVTQWALSLVFTVYPLPVYLFGIPIFLVACSHDQPPESAAALAAAEETTSSNRRRRRHRAAAHSSSTMTQYYAGLIGGMSLILSLFSYSSLLFFIDWQSGGIGQTFFEVPSNRFLLVDFLSLFMSSLLLVLFSGGDRQPLWYYIRYVLIALFSAGFAFSQFIIDQEQERKKRLASR